MSGQLARKFVVVGSGIMGSGIVAGLVANGVEVVLLGRSAAATDAARRKALELAGASAPSVALKPIACGLIDAWNDWSGVDLVLETVTEDLALKRSLFAMLDARVPPDVPIASNSSSLPISRIAEGLDGIGRMFGAHYFMPAHVVPLVEVVLGARSDPALGQKVCDLFTAAGKRPVLVKKDIPGFLANRIQHALMREALSLIDAGIASPEDVDLAVRYSFGFRYVAVGPIVQKEISGWDTVASAAAAIYPSLSNTTTVPRCLAELMAHGHTGMKSGQGFMAWSPESIAETQRRYQDRLQAAFDILASDPAA